MSQLAPLMRWVHKMSQSEIEFRYLQRMVDKRMRGKLVTYSEFCDVYNQACTDLNTVKNQNSGVSTRKLSVNSMKMWLKYDTNRSKSLEEAEFKTCMEDCLGRAVDRIFITTIFARWKVPNRTVTFEIWMKHLPGSSNEETFRKYLEEMYGYE